MQSFSEIDTTSKRASKAAGFSWGVAEEIGKSIRSLELFGLPGIINLNLYLKKIKKNHPKKLNKIDKENKLENKELCPIYSGVAFLDQCRQLEKLQSIKFYNVNYPSTYQPQRFFWLHYLHLQSESKEPACIDDHHDGAVHASTNSLRFSQL